MRSTLSTLLVVFAAIILLFLAVLVVRTLFYGAGYAAAAALSGPRIGTFSVGGKGPQAYGPYTITGNVVMDVYDGSPAVPYIQYLNAKNATSTKQLVYYGARACAPAAGDIPCVPSYSASDGYPQLVNGERITVTGYMYEDRFLITSGPDAVY